jgi:hypothetical protein
MTWRYLIHPSTHLDDGSDELGDAGFVEVGEGQVLALVIEVAEA